MDGSRVTADAHRVSVQREAVPPGPVVDAWETALDHRAALVDSILAAAALRDDRAAIREFEADHRDQAAHLDAFVEGVVDGPASDARQLAKADRDSAKADRIAAELDRYVLADLSASRARRDHTPASRTGSAIAPSQVVNSGTGTSRAHVV
jgi:hypothetical protein